MSSIPIQNKLRKNYRIQIYQKTYNVARFKSQSISFSGHFLGIWRTRRYVFFQQC